MQALQGASASAIVILDDGGVAQGSGAGGLYSAGTYILFVIIGAVGVIYLFRTLFRYPSAPIVGLVTLIAVTALGLIFSPDEKAIAAKAKEAAPSGMDAYSPKFFAMETVDKVGGLSSAIIDIYQMLAVGGGGCIVLVTPYPGRVAAGNCSNQTGWHVPVRRRDRYCSRRVIVPLMGRRASICRAICPVRFML